jgi:hypothetical protein
VGGVLLAAMAYPLAHRWLNVVAATARHAEALLIAAIGIPFGDHRGAAFWRPTSFPDREPHGAGRDNFGTGAGGDVPQALAGWMVAGLIGANW